MFMKVINSNSAGNSYILESSSGEMLILDCGCKWKDILKGINYDVESCTGCLLTHEHGDHSKSYKDLLYHGIPIYTNDETADHFEVVAGEKMIGLQEMKRYKIGSFKVIPFYVPHTTRDKETGAIIPCSNFGWLVENGNEKLLYVTDFEYISKKLTALKINHFLIECNHDDSLVDADSVKFEHSIRGHSSLSTVKEFLKVNKTEAMRNVILCHLSRDAADEKKMQSEVMEIVGEGINVQIAHKDLNIEL